MDEESDTERRAPSPAPPSTGGAPSFGRKIGAALSGIPNWINVAAGIIAGGTAIWVFVVPMVWGPNVTFSATCKNHDILIEIENTGGRAARIGPPVFTINSATRRGTTLNLERYLVDDPGNDGRVEVAPNQSGSLKYANGLNFFGERESANNACTLDVTLPITGEDAVSRTCPCVYSN